MWTLGQGNKPAGIAGGVLLAWGWQRLCEFVDLILVGGGGEDEAWGEHEGWVWCGVHGEEQRLNTWLGERVGGVAGMHGEKELVI